VEIRLEFSLWHRNPQFLRRALAVGAIDAGDAFGRGTPWQSFWVYPRNEAPSKEEELMTMRSTSGVVVFLTVLFAFVMVPNSVQANEREWSDPLPVGAYGWAGQVSVAMDGASNGVAVWREPSPHGPEPGRVMVSRYTTGPGWGSPMWIGGGLEGGLQVAVNAGGEGMIVWADEYWRADYPKVILNATSISAAGLGTTEELAVWDDSTFLRWRTPQVGVDSAGNAMAIWPEGDGARDRLHARRYDPGSQWEDPVAIDAGVGNSILPRLAMEASGLAAVAWIETAGEIGLVDTSYPDQAQLVSSGPSTLYVRQFTPGGGWSDATTLASWTPLKIPFGGRGSPVDIAISGGGDVLVAWYDSERTWASRFRPLQGWDTPVVLSESRLQSFPRVAMEPSGNAHVVWSTISSHFGAGGVFIDHDTYAAYLKKTGGPIGVARLGEGLHPEIDADRFGNFVVVWLQPLRSWHFDLVAASRIGEETSWTQPVLLSRQGVYPPPALAVSPDGDALALWGGDSGIEASFRPEKHPPVLTVLSPVDGETTTSPVAVVSGITEPGASVAIAGTVADVTQDGSFSVTLGLSEGRNQITTRALDRNGNEATITVEVTYVDPVPILEGQLGDTRNALEAMNQSVVHLTQIVFVLVAGLIAMTVLLPALRLIPRWNRPRASGEIGATAERSLKITSAVMGPPPGHSGSVPTPVPTGERAFRFTTKERILLHLERYARSVDAAEVPPELTQEGIAAAVWVDQRHLGQYLGPLIRDGLLRERSAHVRNGRQRRRVYGLTDTGRRVAYRIEQRVKVEVVQIWDGEHTWDVSVREILEKLKGKVTVLDIARQVAQAGVVDFAALTGESPPSTHPGEPEEGER